MNRIRIVGCALFLFAVALGPSSRTGRAQQPDMAPAWSFEVLRHYPGIPSECHPSLMLTGLAFSLPETLAAGWWESGCGLPGSTIGGETGLIAATRVGDGSWSITRQIDAFCGFLTCLGIHGRPALALSPDGRPFYVFAGPGPNDTYHIYVQDMVSGLPAVRRMPIAASQSTQSHPNISATFTPGLASPTFAWAAITGMGGPLMLGLPDSQVTIAGALATWSVDSAGRHIAVYANHSAGLGVYYSPGEAGVLRPVVSTLYHDGVSIAVAPDGRIHLAVSGGPTGSGTHDGRLIYLTSNDAGVTWERTDLDLATTKYPSIALDSAGLPAIIYTRNQTELRFVRLSDATWTNTLIAELPHGNITPPHLVFDATDRPQVLFYNVGTRDIILATGSPAPAAPILTASTAGNGGGAITSFPVGISCGADCDEVYAAGRYVLLTADPDSVSEFAGWAGACTGVGACLVPMDQAKSVAASFVRLDDEPAIEVAAPGVGGCTLIDAIHAANSDTAVGACAAGHGADVIHVPAGTYTFAAANNATLGLSTALPIVMSNITLAGDGAESTIIERAPGAPEFRLLRVWHVNAHLSLRGVTIRGGHGSGSGGGGVYAAGPLVVRASVFSGNEGGTHGGGAIRWSGNALTISRSRFVNNRSSKFEGGALYGNGGPTALLNVTSSTFEGNYAVNGGAITYSGSGAQGRGGLIANSTFNGNTALQTGGALMAVGITISHTALTGNAVTAPGNGGGGAWVNNVTIIDSTIADNIVNARGAGGGIDGFTVEIRGSLIANNRAQQGAGANLGGSSLVVNSTISGNRATGHGAGLALNSTPTLRNVTITGNISTGGYGGGILSSGFTTVRMANTIVAGNHATGGLDDCYLTSHPIASLGHNLIGNAYSQVYCKMTLAAGDQYGVVGAPIDPQLGPLADNGGATWTHNPAITSPALDAGSPLLPGSEPSACEVTDQRGVERPQGSACDIGAVEDFEIAVVDSPPAIAAHDDIVVEATGPDGTAVTYTAPSTEDVVDGAGVATCTPLSGSTFPLGHTTVTCEATDSGGHAATETFFDVEVRDTTPPTITVAVAPVANAAGWHRDPAAIDWTVSDIAGVTESTGCGDLTFTQETSGTLVTCTAWDAAGNSASESVTISLDRTAPSIAFAAPSSAANENGWHRENVSVPFQVSDEGSGLPDGAPAGGTVTFTADGADMTQSVSATDIAGNTRTAASPSISIDKTPPVVTIGSPTAGAGLHTEQTLTFVYGATDSLSGVTLGSPTGALDGTPVISGQTIDLAAWAGVRTFRAEARDRAGNVSDASTTFTVNRALAMDIKPGSCPNPLGTRDRGVLPVAIAGLADFDVHDIDLTSIRLEGVAPLRWTFEDAATPYGPPYLAKHAALDCTTLKGDGIADVSVKFDTQAIVQALGPVSDFEVRRVTLTGRLKPEHGGAPFIAIDVMRIQVR